MATSFRRRIDQLPQRDASRDARRPTGGDAGRLAGHTASRDGPQGAPDSSIILADPVPIPSFDKLCSHSFNVNSSRTTSYPMQSTNGH